MAYWVALGEERTMGAPYLASFEHWPSHAGRGPEWVSVVANVANQAAYFLTDAALHQEAEPLMRRMVDIFLTYTRDTGHPHPQLQVGINNYADLLQAMGRSSQEVLARLNAIAQPYGMTFGNQA